MADLDYIHATGETKLVGQDASGNNVNYVSADSAGNLLVKDILNTAGQNQALSVGTSAVEALGGATILINRKILVITPTNGKVFWGFSTGVTATNGQPIAKNQTLNISVSAGLHIYLISASGSVDVRVTEGA